MRNFLALLCILPNLVWTQAVQSVSIKTAKQSESFNSLAVNATIKNTGSDTLRNLKYVWYLDWSDHKGNLVPELDWSDIPGVTKSVKLRDDYIAEATYTLNGLVLLPGQERHLNTRFHMDNYTDFNPRNDWSYLELQGSTPQVNGTVNLFSGSNRIYGSEAQNPNLANLRQDLQVRTLVQQHSANTLGIDAYIKNTGTVPLTNVLVKWIASTKGRTSPNRVTVDWSSVVGLTSRLGVATNGLQEVVFDLGSQILGVGEEKVVKFRLTSADWSSVDFSKDPSYAGLGKPNDVNDALALVLSGYPPNRFLNTDVDSDGDGYADALEIAAGSDPKNSLSVPLVSKVQNVLVSDTSKPHLSVYNYASMDGYASRTSIPVEFGSGSVVGLVPFVATKSLGTLPKPIFDTALLVGKVLEVQGSIQPGKSIEMAFPLPDKIPSGLGAQQVKLLHFVNGAWRKETVTKVENGAVYANISSLSPFVIGVRLRISGLSAFGKHALGVDRSGTAWSLGRNESGQLGLGSVDTTNHARMEWIANLATTGIVSVAAGRKHSLALDLSGNIWAWGDNSFGQVGLPIHPEGIRNAITVPTKVWDATQGIGAVGIVAGGWSSYAVLADGSVVAWGRNDHGQLGLGDTTHRETPTALAGLSGVLQLVAGDSHAAAMVGSTVYQWGDDSKGQLGRKSSSTISVLSPVMVPFDRYAFGYDSAFYGYTGVPGGGMIKIPYLDPPVDLYASGNYGAVRCYDRRWNGLIGRVIGWGANESGQILPSSDSTMILNPTILFSAGTDVGTFGPNHVLRAEAKGYAYSDPVHGGRWIYWTVAQGSNRLGESGPDSLGKAKVSWKYQLVPGSTEKLESVVMAAGDGYSVAVNRLNDSVYAWGDRFNDKGLAVKLAETRNPPVVAIGSPQDGVLVNSLTTSVNWSVDGVAQTTQTQQNLSVGWNRIQRCSTKPTGETGCASVLVKVDTTRPSLHIVSPSQDTLVMGASFVVRYVLNGVAIDTTVTLGVGRNLIKINALGASDSIRINRAETGKITALAVAPREAFAYTQSGISALGSYLPNGVKPIYILRQIAGSAIRTTSSGGEFSFLTQMVGMLRFELEVKDSANVLASSKDTVDLVVREPATLWEQLQVLETQRHQSEGPAMVSITAPSPDWSFAVTTDTVPLYGLVDIGNQARRISWKRESDTGSFTTNSSEWVHPNLHVNKGDNFVRYVYVDDSGKVAVDRALVTYRDSMQVTSFDVTPDLFYSGQNLTHQVRVRGTFEPGIQSLELVQITQSGTRVVGSLTDDGLNADTVAGDGIWSGSFRYTADTGETVFLRVRATFTTGVDESQIWSFYSQPEMTDAELEKAKKMNISADSLFTFLTTIIGSKPALDSTVRWMQNNPEVRVVGPSIDGRSISWVSKAGIFVQIPRAPTGTMGASAKISIKTNGVDPFNYLAVNWYNQISNWNLIDSGKWDIQPPSLGPSFQTSLFDWNDWDSKKVVMEASHGGLWGIDWTTIKGVGVGTSVLRKNTPIGNYLESNYLVPKGSPATLRNKFISKTAYDMPEFIMTSVSPTTGIDVGLTSEYFKKKYLGTMNGILMYLGSCHSASKSGVHFITRSGIQGATFADEMSQTRFGGKKNALCGFSEIIYSQTVDAVGQELMNYLRKGFDLRKAMDSIFNNPIVLASGGGAKKNLNFHYLYWDVIDPNTGATFSSNLRFYGDSSFVLYPQVVTAGANDYGQLGDGSFNSSNVFVGVNGVKNVIQVSASHAASVGLVSNGRILSWGSDLNGELGNGDTGASVRLYPDTVLYMNAGFLKPLPGIREIHGANFGLDSGITYEGRFAARDSLGRVWSWGKNNLGQTGLPSTIQATRAKLISFGTTATATSIVVGGRHGVALLSDNTVGTFGYGYSIGQGDAWQGSGLLPVEQGIGRVLVRTDTGDCPLYDSPKYYLSNVSAVGAGRTFSFAITADDTVYGWGNNYYGIAGNMSWWGAVHACAWRIGSLSGKGLKSISGGSAHALGLDGNGKVWSWGKDPWGATGIQNGSGDPTIVSLPGKIVKISAGDGFSAVIDSAGNVYVWGRNDHGQLGLGHNKAVLAPKKLPGKFSDISTGTTHIIAVTK